MRSFSISTSNLDLDMGPTFSGSPEPQPPHCITCGRPVDPDDLCPDGQCSRCHDAPLPRAAGSGPDPELELTEESAGPWRVWEPPSETGKPEPEEPARVSEPTPPVDYGDLSRASTIKRIRDALKRRSGKSWSVTGGKGTAYGWLDIDAPPARRTWQHVQTQTPEPPAPGAVYRGAGGITPPYRVESGAEDPITSPADDPWAREAVERGRSPIYTWEINDPSKEYGHMSPAERVELGNLLGLGRPVHIQGHSVPSGGNSYREMIDRAEGRIPTVFADRDWD